MTLYGYAKLAPGGSSTTKSWTRACDVGNTIVLIVQHQSTGNTVATVSDSAGNSWTKAASTLDYSTPATAQQVVDMWVCVPTTAITTINFSASAATYWVAQAKDYAGANTIRSAAKYYGGTGSVCAVTATTGDSLILGFAYPAVAAGTADGSVGGYTSDGFNNIGTTTSEMWEKTATTTGTQTPNVSNPHTTGVVHAAIYSTTNTAPVVSVGAVQNVTTSTATLSATATDDVAVASFSCTLLDSSGATAPSIGTGTVTNAGSASASVTYPITGLVPGVHRFNITATDGGSPALTSATVIGQINYTSTAPIYRSVTAATYTVVGGGTALAAIQAATPSTRYLNSSAPPGGGTGSIAYQPLSPSPVPVPFSVQARASDAVTAVAITVYLKMGGTVIATRGPFTLTTSDASYGGTTTTGETTAITDRSALTTDWSCT
jgi:hypothetical protein